MINKKPFQDVIDTLKNSGKYRVFNDIVRERGNFPNAIWYSKYAIKNIVNWCSNDYLGMGQNKVVIDAMHTALDQTGSGSGGTRNIGGTSHYHVALEQQLSQNICLQFFNFFTLSSFENSSLHITHSKLLSKTTSSVIASILSIPTLTSCKFESCS